MSADDADDDGFDKEAERERLREKYEADQEDREATQQMSELLLQGATMTNKHCEECGNPLFRYEGQTFCASCQQEDAEPETGAAAGGEASGESGPAQSGPAAENAAKATETGEPPETAEVAGADATAPGAERSAAGEPATAPGESKQPRESAAPNREHRSAATQPSEQGAERTEAASGRQSGTASPASGGDDLAAARESVRATLTDLAARAERSNDAAHTRELLAATKEAAQTLRELNRLE